jgi:hypothetical protein
MRLSDELTTYLEATLHQPVRDALTKLIEDEVRLARERGYRQGVWDTKYAVERFVSDSLEPNTMLKERDR